MEHQSKDDITDTVIHSMVMAKSMVYLSGEFRGPYFLFPKIFCESKFQFTVVNFLCREGKKLLRKFCAFS